MRAAMHRIRNVFRAAPSPALPLLVEDAVEESADCRCSALRAGFGKKDEDTLGKRLLWAHTAEVCQMLVQN